MTEVKVYYLQIRDSKICCIQGIVIPRLPKEHIPLTPEVRLGIRAPGSDMPSLLVSPIAGLTAQVSCVCSRRTRPCLHGAPVMGSCWGLSRWAPRQALLGLWLRKQAATWCLPPRSCLRLGSQNHSYSQFGDSVKCLLVQVFVTEGMLGAITVYGAKEQMGSSGVGLILLVLVNSQGKDYCVF